MNIFFPNQFLHRNRMTARINNYQKHFQELNLDLPLSMNHIKKIKKIRILIKIRYTIFKVKLILF